MKGGPRKGNGHLFKLSHLRGYREFFMQKSRSEWFLYCFFATDVIFVFRSKQAVLDQTMFRNKHVQN